MALHHLIFDPTDADSIAATHSVGAYVRAGTDGDLIGSETLNALEWLRVAGPIVDSSGNEVSVTSNSLDVNVTAFSGTDIDIRDLVHTQDSVRLGDGTSFLTSTTVGADIGLDVNIINASVTVTATDLDIRDLSSATDSVSAVQSGTWDIGTVTSITNDVNIADGGNSITVDASDLDIRDLTAASDSVAAWLSDGSGNAITSTSSALDVNIASADISLDVDDDLADTAIENTATAVSTSAVNIVTSALANRKHLYLFNNGNKELFFGKNGITISNGFPMPAGSMLTARIGPSVAPQIIGGTGASNEDLRVMELS